MAEPHPKSGDEISSLPGLQKPINLSSRADQFHLQVPPAPLKDRIATQVLRLFAISLIGTLAFAGVLVVVDSAFIYLKTITPEQRLVTERVVMTFVTATVVQVGTAVAAIVYAVFKDPKIRDFEEGAIDAGDKRAA